METNGKKELLVVHCVDAEGPLNETMSATFERLEYIFNLKVENNLENYESLKRGDFVTGDQKLDDEIRTTFSGKILEYNRNWEELDKMNQNIFSMDFRNRQTDDFGNPWKITWFCLDHINYLENPREKAMGFSVVFRYYKKLIEKFSEYGDELQWHFHPKSLLNNPIAAATSYVNTYHEIYEILSRKIIEDNWFPTCYRPGFHSERQDSNLFLEQWIPFDFGNQSYEDNYSPSDMTNYRFGNWQNAPKTWRGYHPSPSHYDEIGALNRTIFRCLNLGTRLRLLNEEHILESFIEANNDGSAIIAFTDHDFRDISPDIVYIQSKISKIKKDFKDVAVRYCTAEEAAQRIYRKFPSKIRISLKIDRNILSVTIEDGEIFGSQPFLAIEAINGQIFHDNLDIAKNGKLWKYTFDDQTIHLSQVKNLAIAAIGKYGSTCIQRIQF